MSKPTRKPFLWIAQEEFTIPCWPVNPRPQHPGRKHRVTFPKGTEVYSYGPGDPWPYGGAAPCAVRLKEGPHYPIPPLSWWQRALNRLTPPRHRRPYR